MNRFRSQLKRFTTAVTAGTGHGSIEQTDRMESDALHALNEVIVAHPLLAATARAVAAWIVPAVALMAMLPWLASGRGVDAGKRATTGALIAAALAMAINQAIANSWPRPRPIAADPSLVPISGISLDPSFPSDHAAAAFAIAVAAYVAQRRVGRVLLALAVLTSLSRVAVAAHYPTDVLAGSVIGAVAGVIVMHGEEAWLRLAELAARWTDAPRLRVLALPGIAKLVHTTSARSSVVVACGLVAATWFAFTMRTNLLDELPISLLAIWLAGVGLLAAMARAEPAAARHDALRPYA